jgi:hypothetical protein
VYQLFPSSVSPTIYRKLRTLSIAQRTSFFNKCERLNELRLAEGIKDGATLSLPSINDHNDNDNGHVTNDE